MKVGGVVAFCGAGLSAESGIPTFRGSEGLWGKYDPQKYASAKGIIDLFCEDTFDLANFIADFYKVLLSAEPNFSHHSLAKLESLGFLKGVITQNIDNFDYQVGLQNVSEVHGNAYVFFCPKCGFRLKKNKNEIDELVSGIKKCKKKIELMTFILRFMGRCESCRDRLFTGVVLYGQSLREKDMDLAYSYLDNAKTVICIGTSGVTYPAASFPYYAKKKGLKLIVVNPESTEIDEIADFVINKKAVNFFQELMPLISSD